MGNNVEKWMDRMQRNGWHFAKWSVEGRIWREIKLLIMIEICRAFSRDLEEEINLGMWLDQANWKPYGIAGGKKKFIGIMEKNLLIDDGENVERFREYSRDGMHQPTLGSCKKKKIFI